MLFRSLVVAALFVGAAVLMATIAFSAQRYFELQAEAASQRADSTPGQGNSSNPTQ